VARAFLERGTDMTNGRRWYVGVDWASESHHVFLTDAAGSKLGERIFKHGGEGLAEMSYARIWWMRCKAAYPR